MKNLLLVLLIAGILSTSYMLDWPSEIEAAQDAAATYRANKAKQIDRETLEKAIQTLCGENAGWKLLDDGSVQCYTHRGFKTKKVTL